MKRSRILVVTAVLLTCLASAVAAMSLRPTLHTEQSYWAPAGNPNLPTPPDLSGGTADGTAIVAVQTYHSVGLTWATSNGADGIEAQCLYKEASASDWLECLSPWWDDRVAEKEYRGSIIHLKPDTAYTARLKLDTGGYFKEVSFTTWDWTSSIGADDGCGGTCTTLLDESSASTLTITSANDGTAGGWHVYTFDPANGSATIDVDDGADTNITIDGAQYIIIRGLTLLDASRTAIFLTGGSTDIIIEENNISNWGQEDAANLGYGENHDAGIGNKYTGESKDVLTARITIRRNLIHDPRWDTNAWSEPVWSTHPSGPDYVYIIESVGNHVIAYNRFYTDDNKLMDGLHGRVNNSNNGFPGPNSDIFGNIVTGAWDDCIELEGSGENVRVWGNYLDDCYVAFATTPTQSGPLYIFNNVVDWMRRGHENYDNNGERFGKNKGDSGGFGGGRVFVINNTTLQSGGVTRGAITGLNDTSSTMEQMYAVNNWFYLRSNSSPAIEENPQPTPETNFFDNIWSNSTLNAYSGANPNGQDNVTPTYLLGAPSHDPASPSGAWALEPASEGYNGGVYVPNFNAYMQSSTPDVGANEKGRGPIEFGPSAFLGQG